MVAVDSGLEGCVMIGFGILRGLSGEPPRCMDLRNAMVGFIMTASESLLSDGRRELADGCGRAEGHNVCRAPLPEDNETDEPFCEVAFDLMNGTLWLLSVRVKSELVFRFSTISPPAMTTGFIRSRKNGSVVDPALAKLSDEEAGP